MTNRNIPNQRMTDIDQIEKEYQDNDQYGSDGSFDEDQSRGGDYVETRTPEQIRADDQLYDDLRTLEAKYFDGNIPGMSVLEMSYIESILCPAASWKTYNHDPFVKILEKVTRDHFFAHVREINKEENYNKPTQPYQDNQFEYFVKCCCKKRVDKEVLSPFMAKYLAYLKDHLAEINPSFFPTTVPGWLEFFIRIIPGYCKDLLGFDEQQFLTRTSDDQWLADIGMQIPPPVTYSPEQEQYRLFVKNCFQDEKVFWNHMEEFGVSEENCFGITHISGFSRKDESKRGTLLPRNKMDEDSHSHEVMEMKNIPEECLGLLRTKVQEKYPYLWVENAPKWKYSQSDMTITFQKPVKCSIM